MTTSILLALLTMILLLPAGPVAGQVGQSQLVYCQDFAFSTEEDFVTQGPEPPDGNPIISDGDLLSRNGDVCARNRDLVGRFDVNMDLGLDAVDILDVENYLVVFSTELDSPNQGQFTAGDLLATNGAIIPNVALVMPFGVNYDIGLDAVHFIGDLQHIAAFLDEAKNRGREYWLRPDALAGALRQYDIDIWFSTEGTAQVASRPGFLDGDLLSARNGTIIVGNTDLLPSSVPAGIPNRGVDFGLDAVVSNRNGDKRLIYYSTEILYEGELTFTDGDILRFGNGVALSNEDLILPFEPKANFLGLDALFVSMRPPEEKIPRITHIGHTSVADINGGVVPVGGAGTGLAAPIERPFGRWVPIYGDIPAGIDEFRVVYRLAGTPRPSPASNAPGIVPNTGWQAWDWDWIAADCVAQTPWSSDSDGWFNAQEYRRLEAGVGMPADCNSELALTVWDTEHDAPDPEGHYVVWLQWRTGAGPIQEEAFDHHLQLDNTAPENLNLEIPGGACTAYGPADMPLIVKGHIDDAHFWRYRLTIGGGDPPAAHAYAIVNHYDATPAAANVGPTGTGPGNVNLHEVNVTDLPAGSVKDCCYWLRLWTEDRTIIHNFDAWHRAHNLLPWGYGFENSFTITFSYTP